MRALLTPVALVAFVSLGGCSTSDESMAVDPEADLPPGSVGDFDDSKADLGAIEWRRPEEPRTAVLGEPHPETIAYQQCYSVEDDSVDLHIVCDPAWSEVVWYRVDPADVEAALADGRSTFVARFDPQLTGEQILVRASIHTVDEAGETTREASHPQLFAGDVLSHEIDAPTEIYLYVGKGRTIGPWDTGTIELVVTPYFE